MYKLYSDISNHETYLECWGASTKHPDSMFRLSNFKQSPYMEIEDVIFQWALECCSKKLWSFHMYDMLHWIESIYKR